MRTSLTLPLRTILPTCIALLTFLPLAHASASSAATPDTTPAPTSTDAPAPAPQQPDLAELPHWPIGMNVPDTMTDARRPNRRRNTPILAWVPPGATHIRALLIIEQNTDSKHFGEHAALRAVAARQHMAVIYLRYPIHSLLNNAAETQAIQHILDAIADRAAIPDIRHAPWITFGKSSVGTFPFFMGWLFPQRTIAGISYHGETPRWPIPDWAHPNGSTVLYVNVNGESEWDGTWFRHVRPALLNYRKNIGWLPHQVLVHQVGHGNYPDAHGSEGWGKPFPDRVTCIDVWNYLALYVDKALTARLPEKGFPTDRPLTLRNLDDAQGYVIDPRAVEQLLHIDPKPLRANPQGDYIIDAKPDAGQDAHPAPIQPLIQPAANITPQQRRQYFWVLDRELALAWLQLHNVHDQQHTIAPPPADQQQHTQPAHRQPETPAKSTP